MPKKFSLSTIVRSRDIIQHISFPYLSASQIARLHTLPCTYHATPFVRTYTQGTSFLVLHGVSFETFLLIYNQ